jgi:hypothetical protein
MDTITYRAPRLSRVKAAIGALLAALAVAAAVQVTTPDSASAMKPQCKSAWMSGWKADEEGREYLAAFWYSVAESCEAGQSSR